MKKLIYNYYVFKRKFYCLIERIKTTEWNWHELKRKSKSYDKMMSAITFDIINKGEDIKGSDGSILCHLSTGREFVINIDVRKLLNGCNVEIHTKDDETVKINAIW